MYNNCKKAFWGDVSCIHNHPSSISSSGKCVNAVQIRIWSRISATMLYSWTNPRSCTFLHKHKLKWWMSILKNLLLLCLVPISVCTDYQNKKVIHQSKKSFLCLPFFVLPISDGLSHKILVARRQRRGPSLLEGGP